MPSGGRARWSRGEGCSQPSRWGGSGSGGCARNPPLKKDEKLGNCNQGVVRFRFRNTKIFNYLIPS